MTARQTVLFPVLAVLCYLASSVDQAVYESIGLIPLYGQVAALAICLCSLAVIATMGGFQFEPRTPARTAIYLILAYLLLTVGSFFYSPQNDIVIETLTTRVKFALFLLTVVALFQIRDLRAQFEIACIGLTLLAAGLAVFDFVSPTFSSVPGRGAGFFINPNDAAIGIVLFGLIASRRLTSTPSLVLWIIASLGVLVTFSRGGWAILVASLFGLTLLGRFGGGRARFVFVGVVSALFLIVFSAYLSGDLYLWVSKSPVANLLDANTLARLGERGLETDDYSTIEREDVIRLGIEKFINSPFIGSGVGSTISWEESVGAHNMLVMLSAELGILGLVFYLILFAMLIALNNGNVRMMAIALLLSGMTSHNQFDTISIGIALAYVIGSMRNANVSRSVPAARHPSALDGGWPRRLPTRT